MLLSSFVLEASMFTEGIFIYLSEGMLQAWSVEALAQTSRGIDHYACVKVVASNETSGGSIE